MPLSSALWLDYRGGTDAKKGHRRREEEPGDRPPAPANRLLFLLCAQLFRLLGLFFLSLQTKSQSLLGHHVRLPEQFILDFLVLLELGFFAPQEVLVLHRVEIVRADLERLIKGGQAFLYVGLRVGLFVAVEKLDVFTLQPGLLQRIVKVDNRDTVEGF